MTQSDDEIFLRKVFKLLQTCFVFWTYFFIIVSVLRAGGVLYQAVVSLFLITCAGMWIVLGIAVLGICFLVGNYLYEFFTRGE
jgi:hypothetical protein